MGLHCSVLPPGDWSPVSRDTSMYVTEQKRNFPLLALWAGRVVVGAVLSDGASQTLQKNVCPKIAQVEIHGLG